MRTRKDIENEIIDRVEQDATLSAVLTSDSRVSLWRLVVYVISFALHLHERIVEANAENSRPHTLRWYRQEALNFIDGHELIWQDGQFKYDTTEMSETDIANAKPIDHVAIVEAANGLLIIKTAKDDGGETVPIDTPVHNRFKSYMKQIKDAGNRLSYINEVPDDLRLEMTVWVDDLVIDVETGESLETPGTYPVKEACEAYLRNIEFNGTYIKTFLIDHLQEVKGVKIPKVDVLEHRVLANPYQEVAEYVQPFSGHFNYDALTINFKKYNEVA